MKVDVLDELFPGGIELVARHAEVVRWAGCRLPGGGGAIGQQAHHCRRPFKGDEVVFEELFKADWRAQRVTPGER